MRKDTDQFSASLNGNRFSVSADIYNEDVHIHLNDLIGEAASMPVTKQQAAEFARQLLEMCEVE